MQGGFFEPSAPLSLPCGALLIPEDVRVHGHVRVVAVEEVDDCGGLLADPIICVYIYIYICVSMSLYIYIYIYRERERGRERYGEIAKRGEGTGSPKQHG